MDGMGGVTILDELKQGLPCPVLYIHLARLRLPGRWIGMLHGGDDTGATTHAAGQWHTKCALRRIVGVRRRETYISIAHSTRTV